MVALAIAQSHRCEGCGGDLTETLGTEAEDWSVPPPHQCGRCLRISMAQEKYQTDGVKHLHAMRWIADPRPKRRKR